MKFSSVAFIARRYLWPKHSDSFFKVITLFSFLGICLGVATLIVVMSVMNGFRVELSKKILDFNSHLSIYRDGQAFSNFDFVQKIEQLPEVEVAFPVLEGQAVLLNKNTSSGVALKAFRQQDANKVFVLSKLVSGSLDHFFAQKNGIIVGERLAQKLSLRTGDSVTLLSPVGNVTPFGLVPRFEKFQIVGFFHVGMSEYDQNVVLMSFEGGQNFFGSLPQSMHIETYLYNPYKTDGVIEKIQEILPEPLKFVSWGQAHASFFEVIQIERNVMFIILSLIILIAAFNLISGLVILVRDKAADIAILKTMGLSSQTILGLFCLVGSIIGGVGTLVGVALGSFLALNLEGVRKMLQALLGVELFNAEFYFLTKLPSLLLWQDICFISGFSMVLSFFAVLYPAYRAARMNPVQGMRQND